jgi:hypothetical protein
MTAFSIDLQPRRLTVASDTLAYLVGPHEAKPLGTLAKVIPLPHIRAVVFARGMWQLQVGAAMALYASPQLQTIELAAEALPGILDGLSVAYAEQNDLGDYTQVAMLEFVLAGWSEAEQRMRVFTFNNYQGYAPQHDEGRLQGLLPFPSLPPERFPATSELTPEETHVAIIQAIGRLFADYPSEMGGARVGGEVVSWTITPEGMEQRTLHRFADYDETQAAGAAVAARVFRGELPVDVKGGLVPMDRVVNAAAKVSRQERRRMERQARKGQRAA